MDFGEFMASWEPIPRADENQAEGPSHPVTSVPLSSRQARNESDNFTHHSNQLWMDPPKVSGKNSDSKLRTHERELLKPSTNDRVFTTTGTKFSHDIPKENANPAGNTNVQINAECTSKLKRKVMVLPPSESYRGFCSVDDIPNMERRPWEKLSPVRSQKKRQSIESESLQTGSKQVKVMRLVSSEKKSSPVENKIRKICTLQSSPVRDFNIKMIKPSPNKDVVPPSTQNKYRADTARSTVISGSLKDKPQRKSLETKKYAMKISSDDRRHEDVDNHFKKLLKEAKAVNSQMETLQKTTLDCAETRDSEKIKEAHHIKPKVVKKLGSTFSSPHKAVKKPTEKDGANAEKKSEATKKYDRQAAVSYMKQKKAMLKEKQAKELERKRSEEECKLQKLQDLQTTRLKLLKNALRKKDVTQSRRNWEGPIEGESSPPPPLPVHRSNSQSRIKHISRIPTTEQSPSRKSNTIKQNVANNIKAGPSFVTVNGQNSVNPSKKSVKPIEQNAENFDVVPKFVPFKEENLIKSSRKSNVINQHVDSIEVGPTFVSVNGGTCLLDEGQELGHQNELICCEDEVPRCPVVSKSKESIVNRDENFHATRIVSREILAPRSVCSIDETGIQEKEQIADHLEANQSNSNSSSFVPLYEDEMRQITDQINQIGAALKNITDRKVVDKTAGSGVDEKRSLNRSDKNVSKGYDEKTGGAVSKMTLSVEKSGNWCELLRSKDHSLKERKKRYEEENESSDQPHTTTQEESISGGPINELTDEENLYQPTSNECSTRQPQQQYSTSTKSIIEERIVPEFIKALEQEPNPLNFITAYKSKLDMLKQQKQMNRISVGGNKSTARKDSSGSSTRNKGSSCNRSEFKENLTLKDLETYPGDSEFSRGNHNERVYALTDESSDMIPRKDCFQPLLLNELKLHFPPSLKSDTTSGKNSSISDCCESEDIVVNGVVAKEIVTGGIVDDRLFKAKSDSQLEKSKQRFTVSDSVKSLTLCHSLTTLENKLTSSKQGGSSGGSSLSLSAPKDRVRVSGSTDWRESDDRHKFGSSYRRESRYERDKVDNSDWRGSDGKRVANCDAAGFIEPKRVSRERSHVVRPGKAMLPNGAPSEAGGVLEIGNVFSPAAIHLQFQAELSKLDAYEVGLQQLTDSERLHNMALKSLHSQAKHDKLNKSISIEKSNGKQKTLPPKADKHSDVDDPVVLTSSHHSPSSSSSLSSSSNHRDSRQKQSSVTSTLRTVTESISTNESASKQVPEISGNLLSKPNDRLIDESDLGKSLQKFVSTITPSVPEIQHSIQPDSGVSAQKPSSGEGQQHSSVLEQTIATLVSNPGAQVLDSLLNESIGFEHSMSSAHVLTPLFDENSSSGSPIPSSCTNSIFDKCITYEEARSEHQLNVYKSREKELINRVKVQVSWLEFQKKKMKQQGLEEEAKNIKKKQRGLILKSQQIREEIHRLMKAEKLASEERRKLLHQQKLRAMHQLSIKTFKKTLQSFESNSSIAESSLSFEEASVFSEPKSLQIADEQKRKKTGQDRKNIAIVRNRNNEAFSPNKKRFEEKDINIEEVEHRNIKSPKHTLSRSVLDRSTSPFPMTIESEKDETAVGSDTTKSHLQTDCNEDTHAETDNANSVPEELAKSNQSDSVESHVTEELPQYSESTFEQPSFTIHSRQPTPLKTKTDQPDSRSSQTKMSNDRRTTLSSMMIPIKVPLSPRLQGCTRKRYSSGSEDSITFSQNETFSEQSDIEIRLSALHEQLRQRKLEADRLRREQKRAQRERLKCKEQALLKQIQAYDAYIEHVKKELEQEIESPSTVPIMRPQIKQPRFVDKVSLRKPETVQQEKKTTSDEELSSLKSISEASSLETTIQSPGQRDSSVDEQQISEKISSSAASSPPHSENIKMGESVPEVSSATSPPHSGESSKIMEPKVQNSVSEVSSATSPSNSGEFLKSLGPKLEVNVPEELEKSENSSSVGGLTDNATEKWVAAAEFFKNKFSIDSPLNMSAKRERRKNNFSASVDDEKLSNSTLLLEKVNGQLPLDDMKDVEILSSIASSYSEKSNGGETLSEIEEILKESNGDSVESVVESEKNSDSVESIVEQIDTKSEEDMSNGLVGIDTEKILDHKEDISKRLLEKTLSKSSVDEVKSTNKAQNDNIDSVILDKEPTRDEVSEPIKTVQSALDLVDPSSLVGSALNRSSYSKSALELNPYDSADDTFESDVDASENESSVPESKHSSNLSIPEMFPLPVAEAEIAEGYRKSNKGLQSDSEGQKSKSDKVENFLSDFEQFSLVQNIQESSDTNNLTVDSKNVDGSNSLLDKEPSVYNLEDKLMHKETSIDSLEGELIHNERTVADLGETSEEILVQNEVSEEDVLSEVSETLSSNKESDGNLSPVTKSCSSSSESSEFTVQKKAKVVSLNSTDSSDKSNQDYDGSFKEDEVIKVILVEKEKIINSGSNQDFVQVREEGLVEDEYKVEEDEEGEEIVEEEEGLDIEEGEKGEDKSVLFFEENEIEDDIANKESRIDRITDNILLNLLNESLTFSPKVSSSNKEVIRDDSYVLNEKTVNGDDEKFSFADKDEEVDAEDIQTTAPFITALRKENEREKRKSMESVTDKVLEEFIRDATDSVLRIYGKKTGEKLLQMGKKEKLPSTGTAASPPPGIIPEFSSPSKDSSFDSNDGSWLKDDAENELEISGGETEGFWLEEEMGLEHSCKEARELQLQRQQIEQEIKQLQLQEQIPSYFYFREIPNKPPPPYTPPGQARAKIANDRIPTKQQEILAIVNSLTDYIHTQHSSGKDINALTPPRNFITREDSSQGTYKRFLFDLTKQIVIEAKYKHEDEEKEQRLPWQQIDYKQKCVVPRSLEELKRVVARRVKVLYGFEPQVARENLIVQWSKKHNKIDKFLVNELQEEECEWTDFSKQELMLKNKVAADLLDQLIEETASALEKALARKVERLSRVGVDDT